MFVGQDYIDLTSDAQTSYLNLELFRELCMGMGWNLPEQLGLQADAIGEQQLKRTQSGSSTESKRTQSGSS